MSNSTRSGRSSRRRSAVSAAVSRSTGSGAPSGSTGGDGAETSAEADALLDSVSAPTARDVQQAQEDASTTIDLLPRYPLGKIAAHPFNPKARIELDGDLIELGQMISTHGLQQPIVLAERWLIERDDPKAAALLPNAVEWVIIAGHRRWRASMHAGLVELPGLLRTSPCTPADTLGIFNDENGGRKDPSPLMYAEVWSRMHQVANMTTTQIAERVGVKQPHVSKTIKLAPLLYWEDAATEMHAGRLTRDDGYTLLDLPEEDQAAVFAAWKQDQDTSDKPSPLRVHARRHTHARPALTDVPKGPAQSEQHGHSGPPSATAPPAPSTATAPADTGTAEADEEPPPAQSARGAREIAAAVIDARPSATIRGDILVDAALYVDEATADPIEWRSIAQQVLGDELPDRGELGLFPRRTRRDLALARAVILLEQDSTTHETPPPHIERHRERLRELGVL